MIEIRWHGRGGQGAKTASLLLADCAFNTGKYIQGFPEYGPERMGAPITAYNRIDDSAIRIHSNIYEPDYVIVVDDTLIESVDVCKGIKKNGKLLVNSSRKAKNLRMLLSDFNGDLFVVDASKISKECLKANFPNTALLAAIIRITNIMSYDDLEKNMLESFKHKFSKKPDVIIPNMDAIKRGYDEVRGGSLDD